MGALKLAVSVETHSPEYAEALELARLNFDIVKSSRRWVYLTEYLPAPVAEATARFLQKTIVPELFLEHLDSAYADIPDEDRLAVFQENLEYLQDERFTQGTRELLQPSLEEQKGLSIEGWLRFRGYKLLNGLVAELARQGLRSLRLERALQQFRSLRLRSIEHVVVEGRGPALVIKDPGGRELFREFLEGYLDPRLQLDKEDLACSLIRALAPARVDMFDVHPEFRRRIEAILANINR